MLYVQILEVIAIFPICFNRFTEATPVTDVAIIMVILCNKN